MSEEVVLTTFQRLRRRLDRLASGWLHNEDDASDVLQEAFVRLWTSYRHVDEPREVEALSIRVVRNACSDVLRKRQTLVAIDDVEEPAADVSDSKSREEAFNEVERLIEERLSPLQRRVMQMREYEGLSVADIARQMDMQETAVRMNLSRARQTLREMMKPLND
jgi:RNA polymerase sigma-70 factor (ECF subfamily)